MARVTLWMIARVPCAAITDARASNRCRRRYATLGQIRRQPVPTNAHARATLAQVQPHTWRDFDSFLEADAHYIVYTASRR
jgi:hypothetical protein